MVADWHPAKEELVRVDTADVYVAGRLAAHLVRHERTVEFRYATEYLQRPGRAVATTLPLTESPVITPARAVPPYFAGLLPEGRRLSALRSALKTSADDDFSMLLAVGADPIGHAQVVVGGEPCPQLGDPGTGAPLGERSFTDLFAAATGSDPDRGGIAGVQDKVSGRMFSLPVRAAGGAAYILKFDPPEFPYLVRNEAFFLEMAAACGLPTATWKVVADRDGRDGLLVERFDRVRDGTGVRALACEDGCQVSGRYPADKYSLDTEALIASLSQPCAAQLVAARTLVLHVAFAILTGNGDLHAKNLSILRTADEWRVSPAYDLPSSAPYGDRTLAVAIDGSREAQVSRKRLFRLASAVGVPERATVLLLDDLLRRALPYIDRLDELPFDQRRVHDLRRLMRSRHSLLAAVS
jgi:serine/threonine-protein kinase HipA